MTIKTENLNILLEEPLVSPIELKEEIPVSINAAKTILKGRDAVRDVLDRKDHRLIVIIGPCSIHDVAAAKEYASKLKSLSTKVAGTLLLVMRVYFEKPRTTIGWKGLLNDPYINGTFKINDGLRIGRTLMKDIAEIGLPIASEALDPISPQFLQDMISWTAIGARTTESQTHREMASGLSSAVGFKNSTDGRLDVAINALKSVGVSHCFLGINQVGKSSIIRTKGNRYGHIILRGGNNKPNYDEIHIKLCEQKLRANNLPVNIMIDCSHANSNGDPLLQSSVVDNVTKQIINGNTSIVGLMLESNLKHGNQPIPSDLSELKYGVSITDACIDWDKTEEILLGLQKKLNNILPRRGLPPK